MIKKIYIILTAVGVFFTGCGDSFYQAQNYLKGPVEGVGLKKSTVIVSGESEQLFAVVTPSKTENKIVTWKSNDESIATVDSAGVVKAVAVVMKGETKEAIITVVTEEGNFSAECRVTIVEKPVPVTGVVISKVTGTLISGGTDQLTAEIVPADATNQNVSWTSDDPGIIRIVDNSGLAEARNAGSTWVKVTSNDGGFSAACLFTVLAQPVPVTGFSLNKTGTVVSVGASERLFAIFVPANATNQNIDWKSSDDKIAEVDSTGSVKGISAGNSEITATTVDGGIVAKALVTVGSVPASVTGVTLDKSYVLISTGKQIKLSASITPAEATNQNLIWESSKGAVASVGSSGLVTGITDGIATITVKTVDGGFIESCRVSVVSDETYSIVYDRNGGDGSAPSDDKAYLPGEPYVVMGNTGNLVKSGYSFTGWNVKADGTGLVHPVGSRHTMGSEDITLYAQWTLKPTYKVTYNGNFNTGGTGVPVDSGNYEAGSTVTVQGNTGNLTKTGHTFAGWNTNENGTGIEYAAGSTFFMTSPGVTLYARWTKDPTYKIIYNGNYHTGGDVPVDSNNYEKDTIAIAAGKGTLARSGHSFSGWNTNAAGNGVNYLSGASVNIASSNVTLYAKWTKNPTYTVTYIGNGNDGGSGTVPVDSNSYETGTTVTVLGNTGNLTKTGHTFAGWNTADTGEDEERAAGSSFAMGSANVTLYAMWNPIPKYIVTYDANGGTGNVPASSEYNVNSTVTVSGNTGTPVILSKAGYSFNGWYSNSTIYPSGNTFEITSNVTLYALWTQNPVYIATFKGNGNTDGKDPVSIAQLGGAVITAPAADLFSKENFILASWNTEADGTGDDINPDTIIVIEANTVYYAQWDYGLRSTGPGGGLVFYDKGYYSDGWRYMEAAPADTGSTMPWASTCLNTGYDPGGGPRSTANVGDGLLNTDNIIALYAAESKTATAAVACRNYTSNGKNDWYLPSQGELQLMHVNLHQQGLGNFKTGSQIYYWSSTQEQSGFWYQYSMNWDFTYNQSFSMANYHTGYTVWVRPVRRF